MTRARILLVVGLVAMILLGVWAIRRDAEHAGAAKVTQQVERQHSAAVAEARADERSAADVAASIDQRLARTDALSTLAVQATVKDLRDAIDAVPPSADGAALFAAPVDRMRDSLNAGVDRANRAAATADALP